MAVPHKAIRKPLAARAVDDFDQPSYDSRWLGAECARDIDALEDAEPAHAARVLGKERLQLAQVLGHFRLRRSPQRGTPLFLARRAQGVARGRSGDDGGTLVGCLS